MIYNGFWLKRKLPIYPTGLLKVLSNDLKQVYPPRNVCVCVCVCVGDLGMGK
jgi:hypothetical protein